MSRIRLLPLLFISAVPAAMLTITPEAAAAEPASKSCINYIYSGVGTAISGVGNSDPEVVNQIKKFANELNAEADKNKTGKMGLRKTSGNSELSWEYRVNAAWKNYLTSDIKQRGIHFELNGNENVRGDGDRGPLEHTFTGSLTGLTTGDHVKYTDEYTFRADVVDHPTRVKVTTVGILDITC